jgi:hypothetical protein
MMVTLMNEPVPAKPELFKDIENSKEGLLTQLLSWTRALKAAREAQA